MKTKSLMLGLVFISLLSLMASATSPTVIYMAYEPNHYSRLPTWIETTKDVKIDSSNGMMYYKPIREWKTLLSPSKLKGLDFIMRLNRSNMDGFMIYNLKNMNIKTMEIWYNYTVTFSNGTWQLNDMRDIIYFMLDTTLTIADASEKSSNTNLWVSSLYTHGFTVSSWGRTTFDVLIENYNTHTLAPTNVSLYSSLAEFLDYKNPENSTKEITFTGKDAKTKTVPKETAYSWTQSTLTLKVNLYMKCIANSSDMLVTMKYNNIELSGWKLENRLPTPKSYVIEVKKPKNPIITSVISLNVKGFQNLNREFYLNSLVIKAKGTNLSNNGEGGSGNGGNSNNTNGNKNGIIPHIGSIGENQGVSMFFSSLIAVGIIFGDAYIYRKYP